MLTESKFLPGNLFFVSTVEKIQIPEYSDFYIISQYGSIFPWFRGGNLLFVSTVEAQWESCITSNSGCGEYKGP